MRFPLPLLLLLTLAAPLWARPVTSFQGGTGNDRTQVFVVDGPWKLSWDFEGTALRVDIYQDESEASANPIRQAGCGHGSMTVEKGGHYWMQIQSVGDYRIKVETLDRPASATLPVFEGNLERKGTSVFRAPAGWRYRCTSDGVLKVTLFDSHRNPVGESVTLVGGGEVVRQVEQAGEFFFMVQSTGHYRIEVLK